MDNSNDKVFGVLSYLGPLVIISLAVGKTPFVKHHANQGLVLFILEVIFSVVLAIAGLIPVVRVLFWIIGGLVDLVCFIMAIMGIVGVVNGEMNELPVIGAIKLIK